MIRMAGSLASSQPVQSVKVSFLLFRCPWTDPPLPSVNPVILNIFDSVSNECNTGIKSNIKVICIPFTAYA